MSQLELQQLRKTFGRVVAVDSLDLEIDRGELVSLVGPSGCGKTTTLRMVAGLQNVDHG
ncbi:MAG: multiple sugar transport system ATP-binding protein, partial [Chloroflexota bacterium]|nr:multiple sugar transport system ATP-binding protein [Chloroflexota bacterium]